MKYTFGRNPAATTLEKLLADNPSARRKISSLLSDYTHKLLQVTLAKEPETVLTCMDLLRDYTLRRLDVKPRLTPEILSYARNIVIGRHRAYSKGFASVNRSIQSRRKST